MWARFQGDCRVRIALPGPVTREGAVIAGRLVASHLGRSVPVELVSLPGGRNNRVWRVEAEGGPFLLKQYFWSPQDPRDRLGQEWAFLTFLHGAEILSAPAPLGFDASSRCALLEFVQGRPIPPDEVGREEVRQAANFFLEIQKHRESGRHLPNVSEACFSVDAHLRMVSERVARLEGISATQWPDAASLVERRILPLWTRIREGILKSPKAFRETPLPDADRWLSPSDFGFHNALRGGDGRLRFLDFEYAGWDDPAKTLADFCNQPDGLLLGPLAEIFKEAIFRSAPDSLRERFQILEPVYQLKWACICLNGFLPGGRFSGRSPESQLHRAETMSQRAEATAFVSPEQ